MCVCFIVRLPFTFHQKETHMYFFLFQPSKVSKREAKGSNAHFAVHTIQMFATPFLIFECTSKNSLFVIRKPRTYSKTSSRIFQPSENLSRSSLHRRISKIGCRDDTVLPVPEVQDLRLFSSEMRWGRDSRCEVCASVGLPGSYQPSNQRQRCVYVYGGSW